MARDMDNAARQYSAELAAIANLPITLDVALLGVGEDGHIASLFPNHALAFGSERAVIAVTDSPKPPAQRLSLSFGVIAGSREVMVAAFGKGKAEVMQQALENATAEIPVARIVRQATQVRVFLDAEAASELHKK